MPMSALFIIISFLLAAGICAVLYAICGAWLARGKELGENLEIRFILPEGETPGAELFNKAETIRTSFFPLARISVFGRAENGGMIFLFSEGHSGENE